MPEPDVLRRLRGVLQDAAELASRSGVRDTMEKAALDYVTNVDRELDALLTARLAVDVADAPVLSEERPIDGAQGVGRFWVIDPLDGTHNFLAGVPFAAISAALFDGDDVTVAGVCDLATAEVYLAERGAGCWLDGKRLTLPAVPPALIGVSSGAMDALMRRPDCYARLRQTGKLRNFGAQALHHCYVARGRLALAVSEEAKLWDDAAGRLVVEEAGGNYASLGRGGWGVQSWQEPMRSICGHPGAFVTARELFSDIWIR